ncbi:MAG: hypothetical protein H0U59_01090 [Gemmatimonadaceae bacterium]|nr:hypothetical protein [Gemmatimonadaceae bacterium]
MNGITWGDLALRLKGRRSVQQTTRRSREVSRGRSSGELPQLTRDQTLAEYMVSLGAWTDEQAASSRPGATLSSAIGGPELLQVVGLVDLEPGDSIVLCTDGLTRHLSDNVAVIVVRSLRQPDGRARPPRR